MKNDEPNVAIADGSTALLASGIDDDVVMLVPDVMSNKNTLSLVATATREPIHPIPRFVEDVMVE